MGFWSYFFMYAGILTYFTWGIVVAFEVVLVMAGSEFAIEWVKKRYTLKFFMFEVYLFFPLVVAGYIFLEVLPYFLGKSESIAKFDIGRTIYEVFSEDLDELDDEDL
ncbi:MAG TPA: hypothetical protein EYG95_06475 [Campylobacterales bacterium]|nr:hypothetical protein [Campylobacterales bacterium]